MPNEILTNSNIFKTLTNTKQFCTENKITTCLNKKYKMSTEKDQKN